MALGKHAAPPAALATCAALLAAGTSSARPMQARQAQHPTPMRKLLHSHELWATINVCNPADHPNTVGIRGSMPGNGQARDHMYMTFRLQYLNTMTNAWADLAKAASPTWVLVGRAGTARQGGFSFTLKPVTGKPPVTLRGVVDFQWRHGKSVRVSAARPTTASHKSAAGADPHGFSAATCAIG